MCFRERDMNRRFGCLGMGGLVIGLVVLWIGTAIFVLARDGEGDYGDVKPIWPDLAGKLQEARDDL